MQVASLVTPQSRSVWYYFRPHQIPATAWRHRDLIFQLIQRAIASRYRGSVLGIFWSFLLPLTMLAVYTFVFSVVFRAKWGTDTGESKAEFALTLFCGLVLYNVFVETVSAAPGAVLNNAGYVKRVIFPLEILPMVNLGVALINAAISLTVLLLGMALLLQRMPQMFPTFLFAFVPLICLSLGLSWLLASIGVYIRDAGYLVSVVLQMLIFLTPIFYPITQVPEAFQTIMRLNPLTVIIESGRGALMSGRPPDWAWLIGVTVASVAVMQAGYVWFMKTKRGFADVL
jgi:lipopolysaccharide transport system permease protein